MFFFKEKECLFRHLCGVDTCRGVDTCVVLSLLCKWSHVAPVVEHSQKTKQSTASEGPDFLGEIGA